MLTNWIQSIVEPKYPRGYTGRHRARSVLRLIAGLTALRRIQ